MEVKLKFWRHQTSSYTNGKIILLRKRFGWEGEAKYWALNCMIAESPQVRLDLTTDVKREGVAAKLDYTLEEFDTFLSFLKEKELVIFYNNYVTTKDVENLYIELQERRETMSSLGKRSAEVRGKKKGGVEFNERSTHVKPSLNERSTPVEPPLNKIYIESKEGRSGLLKTKSKTSNISTSKNNMSSEDFSDAMPEGTASLSDFGDNSKYSYLNGFPKYIRDVSLTPQTKKEQFRPLRFAVMVFEKVREIRPKSKVVRNAKTYSWVQQATQMHEQDEREWKEAFEVFKFAMGDSFWHTVIRSVEGFRKYYDDVLLKMKSEKKTKENKKDNKWVPDDKPHYSARRKKTT